MATSARPAPQPLFIDAAGHTCLAWWHAPAPAPDARLAPALPRGWLPAGALPLAVVLASSWGEEDLSAYDGLRDLAVALSDAGIGVLRFEWPDSGDSSAPTGSTSLADALAALDAAATQARALSGCDRLAFAGLRLGALLAAHAARARDDVHALVGLLPVASGRAFTREQRLLGAGVAAAVPAPTPGAPFDAADLPVALGGFTQTVRGLEAISALKWPADAFPALREALLLGLPGLPARAAIDALAQAGVRVDAWSHDGLAQALGIAHDARLEPEAIAEIVRWLQQRAAAPRPVLARGSTDVALDDAPAEVATARLEAATGAVLALSAAGARTWMRLQAGGVAVRERVVRIGDLRDREPPLLAGVLSEADLPVDAAARRAPRRAIVLLSAGRERRVGPHRLWVPWARERAARGDVVLRLDLPGIGDSERHVLADPEHRPEHYDARGVDAIARAAAWLRREHGVGAVTVMGLCSGAWQAWQAALAGADVQQVVAVNPLIFHWKPGMSLDPQDNAFGHIAVAADATRALADPARWLKLLTGRANVRVIGRAVAQRARHALRLRARAAARALRWPLEHDLAADLVRVAAQGIALDFVFSCHEPGLVLWREESGRVGVRLARDSRVKVCEIEHADHTFAGTAGRAAFYACLDKLLQLPFPMISPSAATSPLQPEMARP